MLGSIKGAIYNFFSRKIKREVPTYTIKGAVSFKEALNQGKQVKCKDIEQPSTDVVVGLQYIKELNKAEGLPKFLPLTNRYIMANML